MPDEWLPGVERLDCSDRGLGLGYGNDTHAYHTAHTFETGAKGYNFSAMAGAKYLSVTNNLAHFTMNPVLGGIVQLLPMTMGARTLRVTDPVSGITSETNRRGRVHAQTEFIANAARPFTLDLTRVGQDDLILLMNFLRSWGIPDRWAWYEQPPPPYPGGSVPRRWPDQSGHAYHSGWPVNDHGDPGAILAPWIAERITVSEEPPMTTVLSYPAKSQIKTNQFWTQLEAVMRQEGFQIYCGPSYVRSGACRKGKHGHWDQSRHWVARALDIGRDPNSSTPISQYEKTHLTAKALHLRDLYGSAIGLILDRANDHKDHLHADDGQSGYQVNFTNDYKAIGDELVYGRKDAKVGAFQTKMRQAGFSLAVDNSFGPATFSAAKEMQAAEGLRPDGIIGPLSYRGLDARIARLTRTTTTTTTRRVTTTTTTRRPAPTTTTTTTVRGAPPVRVTRISGGNRYETGRALDEQRRDYFDPTKVYLASTGTDDLALAGGDGRVLSTSGTALPTATRARLRSILVRELVIVGGTASISEAVVTAAVQAAETI